MKVELFFSLHTFCNLEHKRQIEPIGVYANICSNVLVIRGDWSNLLVWGNDDQRISNDQH